jgi:transglutaminase-like putative cysteine protease
MAEIGWDRRVAEAEATPTWLERLGSRYTDWEDWLTLALATGATLTVSAGLEQSGWSDDMPPITIVSLIAIVASMFIARSGLSVLAAWPLAVLAGMLVVFWQTLELVGPGNLEQRLDAIYFRFETWFDLAFHGGVSNDSLPFNVLVLSLTWLGVFLFGWSVFRWQNAWIGLIPGGVTLFLDMALVGDNLEGSVLLYMLFGFLLVMRTNLMSRMYVWRRDGTPYPSLLSLSFLNFSFWTLVALILVAWLAPVGPFSTPAPVTAMVRGVEEIGANFVRLSGPLKVKRVVPVHNYTGVLPFQGGINLGEREVMTVRVNDPAISGLVRLRGAVYDEYAGGGWKAGGRTSVDLPEYLIDDLQAQIESGEETGRIIPLTITVERKSVVGTVLFAPGETVAASTPDLQIEVASSGYEVVPFRLEDGGEGMADTEILRDLVQERLGDDAVGVNVSRDPGRETAEVGVIQGTGQSLPDTLVARPPSRVGEGRSYNISGFIPTVTPDELRQATGEDPEWVKSQYLQLPEDLPRRVAELAAEVSAEGGTRYDKAFLIMQRLRVFPVDFDIDDTPPGRDTIDYFLFDSQRGYFDYHASAMAVMLRTQGIPARLAVGFVVDDSDKELESGAYKIRDRSSYAWTEVYFPGRGWIAFNPSPDRPEDLNPTISERDQPEPEAAGPEDLPVGLGSDVLIDSPPDDVPVPPLAPTDQPGRSYNPLLTIGVAAFVALLAGSVFLGWQRSVAGLPYSQQLWEKTVRLATWAGHGPRTGETPMEFAQGLKRRVHDAGDVSVLAKAYNRSRFGNREPEEEKAALTELWGPLRGALLGAIVGRITRRGRGRRDEDQT